MRVIWAFGRPCPKLSHPLSQFKEFQTNSINEGMRGRHAQYWIEIVVTIL